MSGFVDNVITYLQNLQDNLWSDATKVRDAIKYNVSNNSATALYGGGSSLMRLQNNSVDQFVVDPVGNLNMTGNAIITGNVVATGTVSGKSSGVLSGSLPATATPSVNLAPASPTSTNIEFQLGLVAASLANTTWQIDMQAISATGTSGQFQITGDGGTNWVSISPTIASTALVDSHTTVVFSIGNTSVQCRSLYTNNTLSTITFIAATATNANDYRVRFNLGTLTSLTYQYVKLVQLI